MQNRIYFDNAATTPLDPRVFDAMQPYLSQRWGNASSYHKEGREAHEAVELARRQVAELIGAEPEEIVFTGSGTEADATALNVAASCGGTPGHVVASAIEHPAVLESCVELKRLDVEVTRLPVSGKGIVDPSDLDRAIRPDTGLVSVMAANNVIGTLQPIAELGEIARRRGVFFHTDAVQAAGKIPIDVRTMPIDLLSMSAHKLNGPQGVGAFEIARG
jgi:cysteine desulfurase